MKAAFVALLVGVSLALGSAASVDTSAYIIDTAQALEKAAEKEISKLWNIVDSNTIKGAHVEEAFSKGKEEPPVRIAAKYIVSPDEAKAFLEIFEKQKEQALKHDGTVAYRLFKTLDDNITFIFAGLWKSYADLKDHLESESTVTFLKDLAEKRVIFTTTQVIEVARGGDRGD